MTKATDLEVLARRYKLVEFKFGRKQVVHAMLSTTSISILNHLKAHAGESTYQDMADNLDVPMNSLYVFTQRLEENGIVIRTKSKHSIGDPPRIRTTIKLERGVQFNELPIFIIR